MSHESFSDVDASPYIDFYTWTSTVLRSQSAVPPSTGLCVCSDPKGWGWAEHAEVNI